MATHARYGVVPALPLKKLANFASPRDVPFRSQLELIFLPAGLPGVLITQTVPLIAPAVGDSAGRYMPAGKPTWRGRGRPGPGGT